MRLEHQTHFLSLHVGWCTECISLVEQEEEKKRSESRNFHYSKIRNKSKIFTRLSLKLSEIPNFQQKFHQKNQ